MLWNGPVLELGKRAVDRLGPDIMDDPPDLDAMLSRFRAADARRELGDALLDQRLVAGIGNMWKAEALFRAGVSPWARLAEVSEGARTAYWCASCQLSPPTLRERPQAGTTVGGA